MAPIASPAGSRVEFGQVRSRSPNVRDATYFGISFIRSANASPARSGQAAAIPCQVRRPKSSASVSAIPSPTAGPMVSGSKYGIDQPPWPNPPSVSSSGPPGACTTPSRLMKSLTTMRMCDALPGRLPDLEPDHDSHQNSSEPVTRTRSNLRSGNPRRHVPSRLSRCFTGPERVISKSFSFLGVPLMPTPNLPSGFDFTDPDVHAERLPVEELAELRRTAPIWWNEQPMGTGGFDDGGFWVVSKHKDVKEVSLRNDVFSSLQKTAIPRYKEGTVREQIDRGKFVLLNMDAPQHTHLRKIISRGFTPRAVERLRDDLRERARQIVETAAAQGSGDFVEQVSCELPLQAIAGLLGVPQEDRMKLFHWSNQMVGDQDPEFANNDAIDASIQLIMYAMQMAADRAANPGPDIVTKLIEADVDGHKLSDDEFGFFVILLSVAGNETTRNSITQGMMAFTDFPDQWELYKRERPGTAADEIVRWATPVTSFQRTALEDYELSGVTIKKGQRVNMFYRSANFDEEVFDDPFTFNILRDPNPHVGFGGTGAHYCLGANLALMTIDLMFNAIADAMPDMKSAGTPERLRSGWLNGIKHWQVDYHTNGAAKCPVAH